MNVVVINDHAQVNGGCAKVALESAAGLAAQGHAVTFFSAVGPLDPAFAHPNLRAVCTGQHELVGDPRPGRAAVQGVWNAGAARMLRGLLAAMDPADTIVHLHGWTKALSASVVQATHASGFRLIATLHEYFAACPNGGFFDYRSNTICTRTPLGAACLATRCDGRSDVHKAWRVVRQVASTRWGAYPGSVHDFITLSDVSQSALAPYLPADARYHRIANPIDAELQARVDVAANRDIVFVGRLSPEKGCLLLARAAAQARVPVKFLGDGGERAAIEALCPGSVTGWLGREALRTALRSARALALPSLWYEGQPLVVGEAAAMGIPALVPDTCAAREAVADGVSGLWFRGGDADSLAHGLRQLQDDATVDAMGREAHRQFWARPLTLQRHVEALERAYAAVLER